MNEMNELVYKISMVGPTRVGKTSVVASVLDMAKDELLRGTPLTFKPKNLNTEKKIAIHARELKGSIRAGDFNSGAMAGTQAPFTFELALQASNQAHVLDFAILDFPGGWIDPLNRPENSEAEWKKCQEWIHQSSVLIIPVESTVMMEATTPIERKAIVDNILVEEIKGIVEEWAKYRNENLLNQMSTIIFVPVKCESYFDDNVHKTQKNRSDELFAAVQYEYKEVIDAAKGNFNQAKLEILYIPVDTIGIVSMTRGAWKKEGDILRFSAKYRIDENAKDIQPKGADEIFIALCRNIVDAQGRIEESKLNDLTNALNIAQEQAKQAEDYAEQDEGWWGNLKLWWTDERDERRQEAQNLKSNAEEKQGEAESQQQKLNSVAVIVEEIANRPANQRTRIID